MNRFFLTLLLISLLTACAPTQTPLPDTPVDSDTPQNSEPPALTPRPGDPVSPKTDDTIPRPADKALHRGTIYLDSIELLTLESYPLQFSLALTGNLPTPCNHLRVAVSPPDAENKILVEVYSLSAPDTICIQVLQPFSENVPLGSFLSGHYTLWVNGEKAAEFDA